ncbi:hypothetical protein FNJ84_13490 [Paracoccus sp. M683]|uniref:hypothetical protein n=1 Tax=Paracoccus sp. M683 TaxID=2594268 RepID=UPI001180699E|nr:hypothetical protein [Paracoccus sp. M683]TRW96291.1 hypothetical protein FNJ84_13490 [Paracoccus sp. M683]
MIGIRHKLREGQGLQRDQPVEPARRKAGAVVGHRVWQMRQPVGHSGPPVMRRRCSTGPRLIAVCARTQKADADPLRHRLQPGRDCRSDMEPPMAKADISDVGLAQGRGQRAKFAVRRKMPLQRQQQQCCAAGFGRPVADQHRRFLIIGRLRRGWFQQAISIKTEERIIHGIFRRNGRFLLRRRIGICVGWWCAVGLIRRWIVVIGQASNGPIAHHDGLAHQCRPFRDERVCQSDREVDHLDLPGFRVGFFGTKGREECVGIG